MDNQIQPTGNRLAQPNPNENTAPNPAAYLLRRFVATHEQQEAERVQEGFTRNANLQQLSAHAVFKEAERTQAPISQLPISDNMKQLVVQMGDQSHRKAIADNK